LKYSAIRSRVIERMAEYHAGAAETPGTGSTISGQTIYDRMSEVIRDMLDEISRLDNAKILTSTTMTYTANAESMALPAGVIGRDISTVERQVNIVAPLRYDPLRAMTLSQNQAALRYGELPVLDSDAPWSGYGYYIEGQSSIYVVPTPTFGLTLRIRYIAAFADLVNTTDDNNSPTLIPEEHHGTIALETALRFLRETGTPASLEREFNGRWQKFLQWAAVSPKQGPRTVREV